MNLAIISNVKGYSWAGSETVWHLAALLALKQGHNVTAFIHPDLAQSNQIKELIEQGGVIEMWKPLTIARLQKVKQMLVPEFSIKKLNTFDSILVSLGSLPSICYVPGLIEALMKTSTPYCMLCHFNAEHLQICPDERKVVRDTIGRARSVAFVSGRNLLDARRQFALEFAGASVLQNPIRDGLTTSLPWPSMEAGVRFASVARFETAWKGQDLLLDVLSSSPWRDRHWHLTFYGSGPDLEHVQRLVKFFNLETFVSFGGFVNSLKDIWKDNHMLLLPSFGEGLPLAVLEAMILGRPVVATDVGSNREIIQDGVNGFISEGSTFFSFSRTLERAWSLREHWEEFGERSHSRAKGLSNLNPSKQLLDIWTAPQAAISAKS